MPYGRFKRRRRSPSKSRTRVQHSPSTMVDSIVANDQNVVLAVVPRQDAGSSATASRRDTLDRDRTVGVGSVVGTIDFDIGFNAVTNEGFVEYVIWKAERQPSTPTVGTFPIPSDADCITSGLQQLYRMNMPGWVMQFGMIPVAAELPTTKHLKCKLGKFKKGKIRDGDYIGITLFNRTGADLNHTTQMRYYEYI